MFVWQSCLPNIALLFFPPPPPCSSPPPRILVTTTTHCDRTRWAQSCPHWFPPPTSHANARQRHQGIHVTRTEPQPLPRRLLPPTHSFRLHLAPQRLTATPERPRHQNSNQRPVDYDPRPFVWPHLAPQRSTATPDAHRPFI